MAKKDDNTLPSLEEWLAPWERDEDGKALDEPADIDGARLKKYLYGLLSDKQRLQEDKADLETQVADKQTALADLQRQHENDEQRREREGKEREQHYAALEKREKEREKVDALIDHFEDKGITAKQAKALAKRVQGDNEREWLDDADELVDNGFRIGEKKTERSDEEPEETDDLTSRPTPRRANGNLATEATKSRPKTARDELEAAGVFRDAW